MTERLEEIEIKERQEVKLETETVYKKEERPERRETESVSEQVRRGLRITTGREAPALSSCPCSWDPRAGKFPGWAGRAAGLAFLCLGSAGMAWVCVGGQEPGSWGQRERDREWTSLSREGQIPGQRAGGQNKGGPILCLGLQTAAPSPQLPVPPTSLGIALGMLSRTRASRSPLVPQTTGSFSSAASDLRAPDPISVPSWVSCRDSTQPLSFFPQAFDGGGQTSEQPQPGQQRLYNLLVQQPEHQGLSFLVELGEEGRALGCPISFPSPGFSATPGTLIVKNKDP